MIFISVKKFKAKCEKVFDKCTMLQYGKRSVKVAVFAGLAAVCVFSSLYISGTKLAYSLNYRGKEIGVVRNREEFKGAVKLVEKKVNGEDVSETVNEPVYAPSLVVPENFICEEELCENIIENTEEIVTASEITVDGERVAIVCGSEVEDFLNEKLSAFDVDGAECTATFLEDVKITEGLYLVKDIDNVEVAKENLASLSVVTEASITTETAIDFKTVIKSTKEEVKGYVKTTVNGKKGVREIAQCVKYVNGKEYYRKTVSDEVAVEPVDEVITKGTAASKVSAEEQKLIKKAGFIFPVAASGWKISSYYGDGRNHKGIDICNQKGTPVLAVAAGKVVYSGWKGDYGYCVEIDHGNGLHTRYGHASKLTVRNGEFVSAGDVIELMGATGDAAGNHVHFEVIKNGNRVNPAPYLNLK